MAVVDETPRQAACPVASTAPGALPFDDSLLVRVKGKPQKPEQPDEAERSVPISKLQVVITKHGERIKEIKEIIEAKRGASRSVGAGGSDVRSRMQICKNEFQAVLRQKQHIRDELRAVNQQRDTLRNDARAIREKGKLPSEHELEERIQKLEYDLAHSSLSVADEKKATQQLQQLSAQRPLVQQMAALDMSFKGNEAQRAEINKRLQQCDLALAEVKAREDVEKAALDSVKAKADAEVGDIPTLTAEKQMCWEVMQALRDKISEIRNDYDSKYREWQKLDRNYNAWLRWDKQQKYEESRKERAAREVSRLEAVHEDDVADKATLYENEVCTCDQTLAFLRKFVASDVSTVDKDVKEVEAPDGMLLFKRQDVDEHVYMPVGPKKKGNAPKGLAAQQAATRAADEAVRAKAVAAAAAATAPKVARMNNTLETLKTFMSLAIDAPVTVADVPATIEKVAAKKQHYLELRRQALEGPPPARKPAAKKVVVVEANGKDGGHEEEKLGDASAEEEEEADEEADEDDEAQDSGSDVGVKLSVDAGSEKVALELEVADS